jgi:hypothetical protein
MHQPDGCSLGLPVCRFFYYRKAVRLGHDFHAVLVTGRAWIRMARPSAANAAIVSSILFTIIYSDYQPAAIGEQHSTYLMMCRGHVAESASREFSKASCKHFDRHFEQTRQPAVATQACARVVPPACPSQQFRAVFLSGLEPMPTW